jgi:aerobic C4-dicarboxylate transport protein
MLVFGIDKFMSECRALTNLVGNAVASIVVARSEGQFDEARARRVLSGEHVVEDVDAGLALPVARPAPEPALVAG